MHSNPADVAADSGASGGEFSLRLQRHPYPPYEKDFFVTVALAEFLSYFIMLTFLFTAPCIVKDAIVENYIPGVASHHFTDKDKEYQVKLRGSPWSKTAADYTTHGKSILTVILKALGDAKWEFLEAIDISSSVDNVFENPPMWIFRARDEFDED